MPDNIVGLGEIQVTRILTFSHNIFKLGLYSLWVLNPEPDNKLLV